MAARSPWLKVNDPPIEYELDGYKILIPLSHNLPIYRAIFPTYSENLGAVIASAAKKYDDVTVIDIGANVADSAAIGFANGASAFLCIDGDQEFLPYLEHNATLLGNTEVEACYVASADVQLDGLTVARLNGTANLVAADPNSEDVAMKVRSMTDILADHPKFANPTVLKIDTDGHDNGILRSASDFLRKHQPILHFEFAPYLVESVGGTEATSIFADLREWGYERVVLFANRGEMLGAYDTLDENLPFMARQLQATDEIAYWDIAAFAAKDLDVAERLA